MSFESYKNLLAKFVSFKSISTDPKYKEELLNTANWLKSLLANNGFETEYWNGPNSNPVVFAKYIVDENAQTVLVYGHYDVQPAESVGDWHNGNPFELHEDSERLYARGVVDNKGQILIHIHTVLELIKTNELKYNVLFLIEGNEETSNEDLGELVSINKEKLDVDYILVSDGEIIGNSPCVEYSLRGGFNAKLIYKTANNDVHSGLYGSVIPNPAIELAKFIGELRDDNGNVNIPNFYKEVDKIESEIIEENKEILNQEDVKNLTGAKKVFVNAKNMANEDTATERELDILSKVGLYPAIEVTGFKSGYIEEGFSNIIPAQAEVRLNFRTVMSQDSDSIRKLFDEFLKKNTPTYVQYEVVYSNTYNPVKIDLNTKIVEDVVSKLETSYETKVIKKPVGGGIPVVTDFKENLGIDALLVSLGNDDCNMHGVNENFKIDLIKKGLKFSRAFFSK